VPSPQHFLTLRTFISERPDLALPWTAGNSTT
jgi:hypothetical protein